MPTLVSRYVRSGKVNVEARPIAVIGQDSQRGRATALAAAEQNRLFDCTQLLYLNQGPENLGWLDDQMVVAAAASIPGLDVRRLLNDRNSGAVKAQERALDSQATAANVRGTPTIDVAKTGSALHRVVLPAATDPQPGGGGDRGGAPALASAAGNARPSAAAVTSAAPRGASPGSAG